MYGVGTHLNSRIRSCSGRRQGISSFTITFSILWCILCTWINRHAVRIQFFVFFDDIEFLKPAEFIKLNFPLAIFIETNRYMATLYFMIFNCYLTPSARLGRTRYVSILLFIKYLSRTNTRLNPNSFSSK